MNTAISYIRSIAIIMVMVALFGINQTLLAQSLTAAKTKITNVAHGRYTDEEGSEFIAISPEVTIDVVSISALIVTPDEETPSDVIAPNETITRAFKACNTSNITDSYTLTAATVSAPAQIKEMYLDLDGDGKVSAADQAITLNAPMSKTYQPGSCFSVLVVVETKDITPGILLPISITVTSNDASTANGRVSDSGTIINTTGKNASLTNPKDPTLIPQKLVQNQESYISGKNEALDYLITFKNSGDVPALNVIVSDDLPAELNYVAGTLKVNDFSVTDADDGDQGLVAGKQVVVRMAAPVKPGEVIRVSFKATISSAATAGQGVVNVAKISSTNATTQPTTAATAVVDPFGTVYAGRGGAAHPIPGAKVGIYPNENSTTPISIPAGQGFVPNLENTNPYFTNEQGRFSFALSPEQLGTLTTPVSYIVRVTAAGFRDRMIRITLSPDGNGLFKMTVHSLDGMAVAVANGFELSTQDVLISSIADVAFNIPMFENSLLNITKTSDRTQGEIGDLVNYRIEGKNSSVIPMQNVVVKDTLPNGFSYADATAKLTLKGITTPIVPQIKGNVLTFIIGDIGTGDSFSISYRVRIGANAQKGDNYNTALVTGKFPNGEEVTSPLTKALVKVGQGIFAMRQFIIGKIYVDANSNYQFDEGETPVPGARVFLANGDSATTDSQGLYSIPAVSEGAQVVTLDPITIPEGYVLADGDRRSHKDWTRLLRTPLGGGGMLRQNFVLIKDINANSLPLAEVTNTKIKEVKAEAKANTEKSEEKVLYKPIEAGDMTLQNISEGAVALGSAQGIEVSVAENWSVAFKVNGTTIDNSSIGTTRKDPKNKIVSYTFVGVGFKPGPNKVELTAIGPNGEKGKTESLTVYGRGATRRLKIASDKRELQASGRDSTTISIEAFDQWGNPAQDGSVSVTTSAGHFLGSEKKLVDSAKVYESGLTNTDGRTAEQVALSKSEQVVSLENGIGTVTLVSAAKSGKVVVKALSGQIEQTMDLLFTSEQRPQIVSSLAEVTIGKNAPDSFNRGTNETVRGHVQVYYKGKLFSDKNMLTVAYDSQEPLNRISGQDRLFQLNPLDHVYSSFGDSSTRYKETESNSKVYARFDRGRSYAMFGDFQTELESTRLLGYSRKLTGAKVHLENSNGDQLIVSGARPDTAFARQVIPGGSFGLVQLGYPEILQGSEVLALEVRDRRNPEIIVAREILSRAVDYNIDTTTGTIFFLRSIPTFDSELNLVQVIATYEYRANGNESAVYTARGIKNIERLGLRLGFSFVNQSQGEAKAFRLAGADASLRLPNEGVLNFEWARSNGTLNQGFNFIGNRPSSNNEFKGDAFYLNAVQPIKNNLVVMRFDGYSASRNFYNPFGATVTPGTTRGALTVETAAVKNATVKGTFIAEKNLTDNVDNNRLTAGVIWTQRINEKLQLNFGYDFRRFTNGLAKTTTNSSLVTVGAHFQPTNKLDIGIRREQNLGDEDPSFPSQTLLTANYLLREDTKVFYTQRLSSRPITPIADLTGTGFAVSNSRNETAIGVESKLGKYTSLSGRYQLENGINGTDSFSIVGLQNRLPISKVLSLEVGYERAFHLKGNGSSYNNFVFGGNWVPDENFRTSFRYEMRDRDGFGQLFSLGAAGQFKPGWTTLGRFQYGDINYGGRKNEVMNGELALAIRPHNTDRYGVLLSYKHRESYFGSGKDIDPTEMRTDLFSADGFHQTTKRLELYGRFAAKYQSDRTPLTPFASNLNYLAQGRAQYMINDYFDVAAEGRFTFSPYSHSNSRWFGVEGGYWINPDLRVALGYNVSRMNDSYGFTDNGVFNRGGFYIAISTKLSRLFDLLGTSRKGLETQMEKEATPQTAKKNNSNK